MKHLVRAAFLMIVCVYSLQAQVVIFEDDFESADFSSVWTTQSLSSESNQSWNRVAAGNRLYGSIPINFVAPHSGSYSVYCAALQNPNYTSTTRNGGFIPQYQDHMVASLSSPVLSFRNYVQVTLEFYYNIPSIDGGTSINRDDYLKVSLWHDGIENQLAIYDSQTSGWQQASIDLSDYSNTDNVVLEFNFVSDYLNVEEGVYIDDIRITGVSSIYFDKSHGIPVSSQFDPTNIGEYQQRTFTFYNSGSSTGNLEIDASLEGTDADQFSIPGWTRLSIPPGGSDNLYVRFQPTSPGAHTVRLVLNHNASNLDRPYSIDISGSGLGAEMNLLPSPSTLDFGSVQIGSSKSATITISNSSGATLRLQGSVLLNGSGFSFSSSDHSFDLAPGEEKAVTITFSPGSGTSYSGTLTITHNAYNWSENPVTYTLRGTGQSAPTSAIQMSITPSNLVLDFGTLSYGTYKDLTVTIANSASSTGNLVGNLSENANTFEIRSPDKNFDLAPGEQKSVTIRMNGANQGSFAGDLLVYHNADNWGDNPVIIRMTGTVQSNVIEMIIEPASLELDFGDVEVGSSKILKLKVDNSSNSNKNLTFSVSENSEGFTILDAGSGVTVPPGFGDTYNVEFAPNRNGEFTGTIEISHNATNFSDNPVEVTLRGVGYGAVERNVELSLYTDPPTINFGEVPVGYSRKLVLYFRNEYLSNDDLHISFSLTGSDFQSSSDSSFTLSAGQLDKYIINFTPQNTGDYSGTLTVNHDATNLSSPITYSLIGRAITALMELVPDVPEMSFGELFPGQDSTMWWTIQNLDVATGNLNGSVQIDGEGFEIVAENPSFSIPPGQQFQFGVRFRPTEKKDYQATLRILHQATNREHGDIEIVLTGSCVERLLQVQPASGTVIQFPETVAGNGTSQNVDLKLLSGTTGAVKCSLTVVGDDFYLSPQFENITLDPEVYMRYPYTIHISFRPLESGAKEGVLFIYHNASNLPSPIRYPLRGNGINVKLTLSRNEVYFLSTPPGDTSIIQLQLTNEGIGNLYVDTLYIQGTTPGAFRIEGVDRDIQVPPSNKYSVPIYFTPQNSGHFSAELIIHSNAPSSPDTCKLYADSDMKWFLQSTTLSGFHDIFLVDSLWGFAYNRDLYRTKDGGVTWKMLRSFCGSPMFFLDRKRGWVFEGNNLLFTEDSGETWTKLANFTGNVQKIYFIDEQNGWALTSGNIYYTRDGGASWQEPSYFGNVSEATGFFFLNRSLGWAVNDYGSVYKTENGGVSWSQVAYNVGYYLNTIHFVNENEGWCGGTYGAYATKDGGRSWVKLAYKDGPPNLSISDIYFYSQTEGWMLSNRYSYVKACVLHTTDGGKTWFRSEFLPFDNWNKFSFSKFRYAWALGMNGEFVRYLPQKQKTLIAYPQSLDFGSLLKNDSGHKNFLLINGGNEPVTIHAIEIEGNSSQNFAVDAVPSALGVGTEEQLTVSFTGNIEGPTEAIAKIHSDAGISPITVSLHGYVGAQPGWFEIKKYGQIATFFFLDSLNGWILTTDKRILRTRDGGYTATEIATILDGTPLSGYGPDLFFVDSLRGWLCWDINQKLYCTDNGGKTWTIQNNTEIISDVFFVDPDRGWLAFNTRGIARTTDGGNTWNDLSGQYPYYNDAIITRIRFADPDNGWLITHKGNIAKSSNGGVTWTEQNNPVPGVWLYGLFVLDSRTCWIVGKNGLILHTQDGGTHWEQQQSNVTTVLTDVCFLDESVGWIVGENGTILHTVDGGQNWQIQNSPNSNFYSKVQFRSASRGWICSDYLLMTESAGETSVPLLEITRPLQGAQLEQPFSFSDTLSFWNRGASVVSWHLEPTAGAVPEWLTIDVTSGQLQPGAHSQLIFAVQSTKADTGYHRLNFALVSNSIINSRVPITFTVRILPPSVPDPPSTIYPDELAGFCLPPIRFAWSNTGEGHTYHLQVASDTTFAANSIVFEDSLINQTVYRLPYSLLAPETRYYWRVRAKNFSVTGAWSSVQPFVTVSAEKIPNLSKILTFDEIKASHVQIATDVTGNLILWYGNSERQHLKKFSPEFGLIWEKEFNAPIFISIDLATDRKGNIYLVFPFYESIVLSPSVTNTAVSDTLILRNRGNTGIIKFNSQGQYQWSRTIELSRERFPRKEILVDQHNHLYYCDNFVGQLWFEDQKLANAGESGYFVLKIDENGELIHCFKLVSGVSFGIALDPADNLIVQLSNDSLFHELTGSGMANAPEAYFVSIDTAGRIAYRFPSPGFANFRVDSRGELYGLVKNSEGKIVLNGDTLRTNGNGAVVKLSATGAVLWLHGIQGSGVWNHSLMDAFDNWYLVLSQIGTTQVQGISFNPSSFSPFILKISSDGGLQWLEFVEDIWFAAPWRKDFSVDLNGNVFFASDGLKLLQLRDIQINERGYVVKYEDPVTRVPNLSINQLTVVDSLEFGETDSVSIEVSNSGAGFLQWYMSPGNSVLPDWLDVTPQFGTVPPGESQRVTLTFNAGRAMVGRNQVSLEFHSNDVNITVPQIDVVLMVKDTLSVQEIELKTGWNAVSAYLDPLSPDLDSIFQTVTEQIVLVKNGRGEVYWPAFQTNQIGRWCVADGYQVYAKCDTSFSIPGKRLTTSADSLRLERGWNLIGFLRSSPMRPQDAFHGLQSRLVLVKNNDGEVYWPSQAVQTIQDLLPGQAYWIYVTGDTLFRYPESTGNGLQKAYPFSLLATETKTVSRKPVHFTLEKLRTGVTGSILFRTPQLTDGDEIAVFDALNRLVGAGVVEEGRAFVAVRGDDGLTREEKEGATAGERLQVIAWSPSTAKESKVLVSGIRDELTGTPLTKLTFEANMVVTAALAPVPEEYILYQNYPNPFNPGTTIRYGLPVSSQVKVELFNVLGQKVMTLVNQKQEAGYHEIRVDGSHLSSGIYFVRFKAGSVIKNLRIVLLK